MTAVAAQNREYHDYAPIDAKHIYLRRSTPKEPTELVIGHGDSTAIVYRLTPDQLRNLAQVSIGLYFSSVGTK